MANNIGGRVAMTWGFRLAALNAGLIICIVALPLVAEAWWVSVGIIEVIAAYCFTIALTQFLPTAIRGALISNCTRLDGSWSSKRERIELRAVSRLRGQITSLLLCLVLVTNIVVLVGHTEVIPLSIGLDAAWSFRPSEADWIDNLRDEESRFDAWMVNRASPKEARTKKHILWQARPIFLAGVVVWIGIACWVIKTYYAFMLQELAESVQFRAQQYRLRDLHVAAGMDDRYW